MNNVYIMIDAPDGSRQVVEAPELIDILTEYIKSENVEEKKYIIVDNHFSIKPFNSVSYGLTGKYLDVYCYLKETESMFLISRNFKKLSALCGFLNRVIDSC